MGTGVFLSNELFDAYPRHRVIDHGGQLYEILIDERVDGFVEAQLKHPMGKRIEVVLNRLLVLTFNAFTLRALSKRRLFACQLSRLKVFLAGGQETRSKRAGVCAWEGFIIASAPADDAGNFGSKRGSTLE